MIILKRRHPVIRNKRGIHVNIYRREELFTDCSSIQDAARFFKEYTQDTLFRWSPINKSLWYDEPYSINGNTY